MSIKGVLCSSCGRPQLTLAKKSFTCKYCGRSCKLSSCVILFATDDPSKARELLIKYKKPSDQNKSNERKGNANGRRILWRAIKDLKDAPSTLRRVFEMISIRPMTSKEIAEKLGFSIKEVRVALQILRRKGIAEPFRPDKHQTKLI